jgi:hypothetical protein
MPTLLGAQQNDSTAYDFTLLPASKRCADFQPIPAAVSQHGRILAFGFFQEGVPS